MSTIFWSPVEPTSIVAATVVVVVDQGTNVSSTTTVFNDVAQFSQHRNIRAPAATNAGGTAVTTLTLTDPLADTNSTVVVAYPTPYLYYPYSYTVAGAWETTAADGSTGCATAESFGSVIQLPSHPDPSETFSATIPEGRDDKGVNFLPMWGIEGPVSTLFPDVGPLQSCSGALNHGVFNPAEVLVVASYLTETSTYYKAGGTVASGQLTTAVPNEHNAASPSFESSAEALPAEVSTFQHLAPAETSVGGLPAASTNSPYTSSPATAVMADPAAPADSQPLAPLGPAPTSPPITVGTDVITPDSLNHYTINPQTLTPGDPAITVSSTLVGVPAAPAVDPAITIGDQVITPDSAHHFIIGSQTLTPGGPAITISGTPVSIPAVPAILATHPAITVGDQVIAPDSATHYIIGSQTLVPGGPAITISDTLVSVPTVPAVAATYPAITVGDQVIAPDSATHYIIGSQTLVPGGPAITISGTPVSVPVIADSHPTYPAITIGGQVITPDYANHFIIGSQTLFPGGPAITISGTPVSIPATLTILTLPLLTIGGQIVTADLATRFVIGSQTLVPGGSAITISGTPISLEPGATGVVIGTSTVGLGTSIASGLSGPHSPTASGNGSHNDPVGNDAGHFDDQKLNSALAAICLCALAHTLQWV
ncbi:hypothetical protein GP486_002641 [Trichoglossum hirsutum]|uniref:Uncharacterized protein n=1 Tax=Trichoglossum hirsutum TaxID=265104 RepID=A0A9P8RRI7_9PEZI|nr:hypothetical protein GP486_002641 [Trichoglossum hirsutum]